MTLDEIYKLDEKANPVRNPIKVMYKGKVHDFGYVDQTGYAIIYEEGECNMQDAIAVNPEDISLAPSEEELDSTKLMLLEQFFSNIYYVMQTGELRDEPAIVDNYIDHVERILGKDVVKNILRGSGIVLTEDVEGIEK